MGYRGAAGVGSGLWWKRAGYADVDTCAKDTADTYPGTHRNDCPLGTGGNAYGLPRTERDVRTVARATHRHSSTAAGYLV